MGPWQDELRNLTDEPFAPGLDEAARVVVPSSPIAGQEPRPIPDPSPGRRSAATRLARHALLEAIERYVDDSPDELATDTAHPDFLCLLAERFARERLTTIAKTEGSIVSDTPSVLFLCVHNAGRSQMAAGFLQHLGGDGVTVMSGGSEPASSINPSAVEAMAEKGIDIADQYPKPWTEETVGVADVIVSMGCGDACPVLPGKRYVDWDLEDPAGKGVASVRPIRDDIERRVRGLMAELGVEPSDG